MGRSSRVAGVRKFDTEAASDQVVRAFWTHGYEATSLDELTAAAGINRQSFYNAFGGKKQAYLMALDRYWERIAAERRALLEGDDPREGVRQVFERLIERLSDPASPPGCLVTNAAVEAPGSPFDVGRRISAYLLELEELFVAVLRRAQARGQLDMRRDARALARFYVASMRGLALVARAGADRAHLADIASVIHAVWDAPAP